MNNYYVPDFEMEDDQQQHLIPNSSANARPKENDDEILELLWQDGQIVAQPQNQHKSQPPSTTQNQYQNDQQQQQQQQQQQPQQQHLYMAEDEMATWLHYPMEDLYSELYQAPPPPPVATVSQQQVVRPPPPSTTASSVRPPPVPPPPRVTKNFPMFSKMRGKDPEVSSSKPGLTVVESNTTPPALTTMKSIGEVSSVCPAGGGIERLLDKGGGSGEVTVSSSSGGYSGGPTTTTTAVTASEDLGDKGVKSEVEDRKRKQRAISEPTTPTTATDQDVELEADDEDEKKHSRGSKRSRAAEVHNLSERRRRDRINEKMKALQELIPRCNKSDKASMLDEAIEYLKSLQMQVQMMSMGCGMVPMMYPGMQQQYMPQMGLGLGMGIDMGMNRPMMPYPPSTIPGSNMQMQMQMQNPPAVAVVAAPAAAAAAGPQYGPRFTGSPIRMPSMAVSNLSVNQASNQPDSSRTSNPVQSPGLPQLPNMSDPYQQYMAAQQIQMQMQMQMQMQAAQNQSISQPGSSRPSTSRSEGQPGSSRPSTSRSEGQPGPNTSKNEAEDDQ